MNQTPTSARFMSFPTTSHSIADIENHDINDPDETGAGAGSGGEMGFLVAEHMTTELRRLMALLSEKDVALKEMQEKARVLGEEEDGLRKRLEISNGQQGKCRAFG
jgi:hypothetical protein